MPQKLLNAKLIVPYVLRKVKSLGREELLIEKKQVDELDDVVESLVLISMMAELIAKKIIKNQNGQEGGNNGKVR